MANIEFCKTRKVWVTVFSTLHIVHPMAKYELVKKMQSNSLAWSARMKEKKFALQWENETLMTQNERMKNSEYIYGH